MSRVVPPFPLYAFMVWTGTTFSFTLPINGHVTRDGICGFKGSVKGAVAQKSLIIMHCVRV
jgi:hypothetical protein